MGDYLTAFVIAGVLCLIAAALVVYIPAAKGREQPATLPSPAPA
jgi:hypothetical protein